MATPFTRSMRALQADGFERTVRGLLISIALLVCWLAWVLFTRVDVVVTARGALRPDVADVPVMSSVAARVQAVQVREGERVQQGQVLFVLESRTTAGEVAEVQQKKAVMDLTRHQVDRELPLEEASLQVQVTAEQRRAESLSNSVLQVRNEQDQRRREYELQRREIELEASRQQEHVDQVALDLKQAEKSVFTAREVLDANRTLAEKKLVSRLTLLDLENKYQQAVTDRDKLVVEEQRARKAVEQEKESIDRLASTLDATTTALLRQEQQLSMDADAARSHAAQLGKELDLASRRALDKVQSADADYRKAVAGTAPGMGEKGHAVGPANQSGVFEVKAPASGRISTILIRQPGAVVASGDTLLRIMPEGAPLLAEAWVANRDAGQLQLGLPVKVKLDAYPYEQYGAVPASIAWIAPDAEPNPELGMAYRIKCTLSTTQVRWEGHQADLSPGLAATVEIVAGRKPVLSILMQNVREMGEGFQQVKADTRRYLP